MTVDPAGLGARAAAKLLAWLALQFQEMVDEEFLGIGVGIKADVLFEIGNFRFAVATFFQQPTSVDTEPKQTIFNR